jgi:hypothetical protein
MSPISWEKYLFFLRQIEIEIYKTKKGEKLIMSRLEPLHCVHASFELHTNGDIFVEKETLCMMWHGLKAFSKLDTRS